jgi:RimJ/RimL family protein N-acetyltransferase
VIGTDGVVTLKAPGPGDAERLVAGRDAEFDRWLGPGDEKPAPTACVWVGEELVGWVDYDYGRHRHWLEPGEVNVGYYLFPDARGRGYASRAVELLVVHLERDTEHTAATLTIDPGNERSAALARRCRFDDAGTVGHDLFFRRRLTRRLRA